MKTFLLLAAVAAALYLIFRSQSTTLAVTPPAAPAPVVPVMISPPLVTLTPGAACAWAPACVKGQPCAAIMGRGIVANDGTCQLAAGLPAGALPL